MEKENLSTGNKNICINTSTFLLVYLLHVVSRQCVQRIKKIWRLSQNRPTRQHKGFTHIYKRCRGKKKDQKEKTIVLIDPKPNLSARTNLAKALE